jgi:hypothetical protein
MTGIQQCGTGDSAALVTPAPFLHDNVLLMFCFVFDKDMSQYLQSDKPGVLGEHAMTIEVVEKTGSVV